MIYQPFRDLFDSTLFAVLALDDPPLRLLEGGGLLKTSSSPPNTMGMLR